jgi:hypothetical protein
MGIPDHISESLETIFWVKFLDADPDPGSGIYLTLDLGSGEEKFGSGIWDKHPGSATLVFRFLNKLWSKECRGSGTSISETGFLWIAPT